MSWDRVLRVHAIVSTAALVTLGGLLLSGRIAVSDDGEMTVRLLNVEDSEGNLRMQLAGDFAPRRAHLGGILFHNADGSEAGGLVYNGKRNEDGTIRAGGLLTFDQYQEDQIMALEYAQAGDRKRNGLRIMDRPDEMGEAMGDFYRAFAEAETDEERARLRAEVLPTIPAEQRPQQRLYVGRDLEGNAVLNMRDASGRPRLRLEVEPAGAARIVFLDEEGEVQRTVEP